MIYIVDAATGYVIVPARSWAAALAQVALFEKEDYWNGEYIPDRYRIVEKEDNDSNDR